MMATMRKFVRHFAVFSVVFIIFSSFIRNVSCKKSGSDDDVDKWKKKDVLDYSDADLERLYDQWEEDEEPLEEDELPEWQRPKPKIDMSKIDPSNPEAMLQMTKKGQTLMMFATVSGDPEESETEKITQLWQSSLFNANYELQRYIVGSNRVLFMLKDGAKAFEIKDYITQQERCELVTIEGQDYHGKGSDKYQPPKSNTTKQPKKDKKTKTNKKAGSKNDIKVEL